MKKLYQFLTFYLIIFVVCYFIYIFPFEILNEFLFNEKISRSSSLYYTVLVSVLVIFYFRTYNTFKPLRIFVYEGMGVGFISFWIINIALLINYIFIINKFYLGIISLFFITILSITALLLATLIKTKNIQISTNKINKNYSFIFLSDVHLGSNNSNHLRKIINKINITNFDFLLIGGDLIDSSSFSLQELQIFDEIKKPIIFITGNHEYYIKNSKEKINELKKYNINHLSNNNSIFQDINFIGIDDNVKKDEQINLVRNKYIIDKFNIILVHKSLIWDQIYSTCDLMLSGHTHNGQIFPFNLLVRILFKYKYGFFKKDKSNLYVTSGAGCWGPKMRLGTFNEIIIINLIPK